MSHTYPYPVRAQLGRAGTMLFTPSPRAVTWTRLPFTQTLARGTFYASLIFALTGRRRYPKPITYTKRQRGGFQPLRSFSRSPSSTLLRRGSIRSGRRPWSRGSAISSPPRFLRIHLSPSLRPPMILYRFPRGTCWRYHFRPV